MYNKFTINKQRLDFANKQTQKVKSLKKKNSFLLKIRESGKVNSDDVTGVPELY